MSQLVVSALSVRYPEAEGASDRVVSDLSFSLEPGEIGCLVGASGCGKTTVLRAIAGFLAPSAGTIELGGRRLASAAAGLPPEARRIGMVFQDFALFPHLDVRGNVGFGISEGPGRLPPAQRRRRIDEMLERVHLVELGNRFVHQLSGGQQQRVAIARALAPRPALLLLDEPFSSLDADLREALSLELRAILKEAGTTAVFVTHDQREAFAVSDRVGVMRAGRLEQWDRGYVVYHQPATRYVADFIGEGVFLPGVEGVEGIEGAGTEGNEGIEGVERAGFHGVRRVDTEIGVITAAVDPPNGAAPDLRPEGRGIASATGREVDVLLRPDDVVHDDAAPMTAAIVRKAFRGAEFLYTLRLASGRELLALVPSHHDHDIGERIGIRLAADHVVTFPRSPAAAPVAETPVAARPAAAYPVAADRAAADSVAADRAAADPNTGGRQRPRRPTTDQR
ncbi:MAG: ABC transporter ATP-binding protein [Burkholderiaceae bacterium]